MDFAVAAFVLTVGLAAWTYLCLPRAKYRIISTLIFLAMSVGIFVAGVEMLGKPKSIALEWRDLAGMEIAGIIWNENEQAVYIWASDGGAPVAYSFPWPSDQKQVDELQDLWRQREATGDRLLLTGNLGGEDGDIAEVIAEERLPPKD